jgi:methionyl-tRNA formyltransferase
MTTGLDAGDMLAQEATPIGLDETAGELEARLGPLGARLALRVIDQLAQGHVTGVPQDKSLVTKAPKLTKEHGLIDWSLPAQTICNHVRAMQPWPTAYTILHQPKGAPLRVIVCKSQVSSPSTAAAGTVHVDGGNLWARAGDGQWVQILELQPAGKRRMCATDFLRGHALPSGTYFAGHPER